MLFGPKNEDIAAMRLHEVVAELVDKNLVAGIDRAARDDFVRADNRLPGRDLEIVLATVSGGRKP